MCVCGVEMMEWVSSPDNSLAKIEEGRKSVDVKRREIIISRVDFISGVDSAIKPSLRCSYL
jgi:hypothetical protein